MKGKEIERKFLVDPEYLAANGSRLPSSPDEVTSLSYDCSLIEQAYLCADPVVRVRRDESWRYDDADSKVLIKPDYILTCKGKGSAVHDELNLPMTEEAYSQLFAKNDGYIIRKLRYRIPLTDGLTAELDVFTDQWAGRVVVEVEFPDVSSMNAFRAPSWFLTEVTDDPTYRNAWMRRHTKQDLL